jgi:branched-subunit amino acid aminotransferase/4-amino-4-deoxychorismate lyase
MLQLNLPEEWSTIFSSELSLLGWLHTFTDLHPEAIRMKVGVARASGGLYTPDSQQAEVFVETSTYIPPATTVSLAGISQQVVLVGNAYSKLKTLSALPYVVAAQERQRNNWPEILLPNADGLLVEAGSANLFWHLHGQWYTTHEGSGAVLGTMQPRLSAWLAAHGFHVSRASGLPKQSLADLDHLLLTNAAGIRVLGTVKGTNKLYTAPEWLAEAINHCAPHQVKGTA